MHLAEVVQILIYAAALVVSVLSLTAAVVYWKCLVVPRDELTANVSLILPLTGPATDLERLLAALNSQTLLPRRLLIAVESEQDPAYQRAMNLSKGCAFPVEIVLAGFANFCAQKCWNQIAALRCVDSIDEAVVFLDADILPQNWWLSAVVAPLIEGSADIVSGYRWTMVEQWALGAQFIAAIDRPISLLPRFSWTKPAWGGTLGFTPSALRILDLEGTLSNTLSDDCTIGDRAAKSGLRVLMRRALLLPTHLRSDCAGAWQFGRRQAQIVRIYRPGLWWLTLGSISARPAAWILIVSELPKSDLPLAVAAALLILSLAGALVQQAISRQISCVDSPFTIIGQMFLAVLRPVVDLFFLSMILAAWRTDSVSWRHVTYTVEGPLAVRVACRAAPH